MDEEMAKRDALGARRAADFRPHSYRRTGGGEAAGIRAVAWKRSRGTTKRILQARQKLHGHSARHEAEAVPAAIVGDRPADREDLAADAHASGCRVPVIRHLIGRLRAAVEELQAGGKRDRARAEAAGDLARRSAPTASRNCARSSKRPAQRLQQLEEEFGASGGRAAAHARNHHQGAPRSRDRQEGIDRGQSAPGGEHRQALHQPRPAIPRPDSGRQHRSDEGGG